MQEAWSNSNLPFLVNLHDRRGFLSDSTKISREAQNPGDNIQPVRSDDLCALIVYICKL